MSQARLGLSGPVLWALAILAVAIGIWATATVNDAAFFGATMLALAGILAFGTAPIWMVGVTSVGHKRRTAAIRRDAEAAREPLEAAFRDGLIDRGQFDAWDRGLGEIGAGRAPGALAAATAHYLRGVAFGFLTAGLLAGLAGLGGTLLLLDAPDPGLGPLVAMAGTFTLVAIVAGIVLSIIFGSASAAAAARARTLAGEDAQWLRATRASLLELRRTGSPAQPF